MRLIAVNRSSTESAQLAAQRREVLDLDHLIEHLPEILLHTLEETARLIPFLFLTYLLMEFLEHKSGDAAAKWLRGSGKIGPLIGGAFGIVPQCGFSAAASGLYSGRIITVGTLLAVFLSTSDEMLPILISHGTSIPLMLKLLFSRYWRILLIVSGHCWPTDKLWVTK